MHRKFSTLCVLICILAGAKANQQPGKNLTTRNRDAIVIKGEQHLMSVCKDYCLNAELRQLRDRMLNLEVRIIGIQDTNRKLRLQNKELQMWIKEGRIKQNVNEENESMPKDRTKTRYRTSSTSQPMKHETTEDPNKAANVNNETTSASKAPLQQSSKKPNITSTSDATFSAASTSTTTIETTTPTQKPKLKATDCQDVYNEQETTSTPHSGIYRIYPNNNDDIKAKGFDVFCDMRENTGWLLIQRRISNETNFYQDWENYVKGFGSLSKNFWLGNDKIALLTSKKDYKIKFELMLWDNKTYEANYKQFRISDSRDEYRISINGYHGNAGDAMSYHNRQKFSTNDVDNDDWTRVNCASDFHGGWWYRDCYDANLNGRYYNKGYYIEEQAYEDGIEWSELIERYSLKKTAIMITPKPDFQ